MLIVSEILSVFLWIIIILICWFVFVEIVIRILRRYIRFPIPACIARFIDILSEDEYSRPQK